MKDRGHGQQISRETWVTHLSFEPDKMILDTQSFFKQAAKFNRTQVDIPEPMIYIFHADIKTSAGR